MNIKNKLGTLAYDTLLAASLTHLGEISTAQLILEKLQHHNTLRMVTLGGSITEGTTSYQPISQPYGNLIQDFLAHYLYGEKQVEFLNLGVSCGFTMLGLFLTESHIQDFGPDLIIVEFSVNESLDKSGIARFESLIRKLMYLPTHPIIIILTLADQQGYTASSYMSQIGKYYNLPVISIEIALKPYFENHTLCWADYSSDTIHPHEIGHRLIADCCCHYLKEVSLLKYTKKSNTQETLPPCCFFAPYTHLHFLNAPALYAMSDTNFTLIHSSDALFSELLYNDPTSSHLEQHLTFSLNCKTLIFLFIQTNDVSFATAILCTDHAPTHFLQGYCQFVHQYPRPECVIEDDYAKMHHIALHINDLDAMKDFYLIGVGWC